jgi:hypothetical protein
MVALVVLAAVAATVLACSPDLRAHIKNAVKALVDKIKGNPPAPPAA